MSTTSPLSLRAALAGALLTLLIWGAIASFGVHKLQGAERAAGATHALLRDLRQRDHKRAHARLTRDLQERVTPDQLGALTRALPPLASHTRAHITYITQTSDSFHTTATLTGTLTNAQTKTSTPLRVELRQEKERWYIHKIEVSGVPWASPPPRA